MGDVGSFEKWGHLPQVQLTSVVGGGCLCMRGCVHVCVCVCALACVFPVWRALSTPYYSSTSPDKGLHNH